MTYQKSLSDLQFKVTRTILTYSAILFVPIFCFDLYLGFYHIALLKIPVVGIFAFVYYKLLKVGFQEKYIHLINFSVLGFIALNYLGNQGTDGPSLYACMAMFVVYPILLSNTWKWIYALITIGLVIVLLFFGTDKNNLLLPEYASPMQQFFDHAATYTIMGIYIIILVGMVLELYKKQNLNLAIAQEQLKDQMELVQKEKLRKENLLGILAHDVRTPIRNLGQLFELYQDDLLTQQELKELMNGMQSRIEDLRGTIDGILGQLNTEIKQEKAKDGTGNPIFATERVIKLLQYKLDAKNQQVQFLHAEASDFTSTIGIYTNEISIILKNLIDNAHKYSGEGSLIRINLKQIEKQLIWEVEDEGGGMAIGIQKQLFKNTLPSDQGSGMGLYLCQSIAQSIGATITYQPTPKGSMFSLRVNL